jgi:hypothetical protein
MTLTRSWMVLALPLLTAAASDKGGGAPWATDFAEGSMSLLVSKRCEKTRADTRSLDWNALVYSKGPPVWGRKAAGACRGLDTWVLSEALAAGAMWNQTDHKVIEADPMKTMFDDAQPKQAFKQTFGWELPERGDDVPAHNVFLKFSAQKLAALFDRIYFRPTDTVAGTTGQEVYDVFFKDAVTRFAREVALIKTNVPNAQMGKLLKAYQTAARTQGAKFRGPAYLKEAAATALAQQPEQSARAGRTLGVMLRRTADGTWTTINRLLKKVVTDYDPALAQDIGKAL